MALINSLTSGVSALKSFTKGMEVIGDNISNVNTTAFKSSRIDYTDSFSNMLRNSSPSTGNASNTTSSQLGTGVEVQTVATNFSQGNIDSTGVETDLAIAGEGFFRVTDPVSNTEYATRAGNFRVDDSGYITTTDGYRVQGLMGGEIEYDVFLDVRNNLVYRIREDFPTEIDSNTVADLNVTPRTLDISTGTLRIYDEAPSGLTTIPLNNIGIPFPLSEFDTALDLSSPLSGNGTGFSFGGPYTTLDSIESAVRLGSISEDQFNRVMTTVSFTVGANSYSNVTSLRTAIDNGIETEATIDAALASVTNPGAGGFGNGIVPAFNSLQELRTGVNSGIMTDAEINSALAASNLTIDGSTYDGSTTGLQWNDLNALYKLNPLTSDSYSIDEINTKAPRMEDFSFDQQGNLSITMSDGNGYNRGRVNLVTFNDPQALVREGAGLYTGFDAAGLKGDFLSNFPGENGVGKILQRSLEQSNVDLTSEFANMITAQRSFQAGSRIVTVSDEILNEVVNLKR